MSDETTTPDLTQEPVAETPEAKARKARTVYPIRICRVEAGALTPLKGAPAFSDQRLADVWIRDNGTPGGTYCAARLGPRVTLRVASEEADWT